MASIVPGSPFKAGGEAQLLPVRERGGKSRVIIRCDDDDAANRILIKIGRTASVSQADFFLGPGEALEIHCSVLPDNEIDTGISILNVGNDPDIYWGRIA